MISSTIAETRREPGERLDNDFPGNHPEDHGQDKDAKRPESRCLRGCCDTEDNESDDTEYDEAPSVIR